MTDKTDNDDISAETQAKTLPETVQPEPEAAVEPDVPEDDDDHHHDDDEHHVSLATLSLQILGILFVGGALALWTAPRLAPLLPDGMGAVARWITPGASLAEAQVAELHAEIAEIAARQAPALDLGAIDARIAAADTTAALREEMAVLLARIEAAEAAPGALATRIDSIESRLAGDEAMLTSIDEDLRGLVTAGLALDSQSAADISAYGATIDGLRAQFAELDTRIGNQAARLDAIIAEIRAEAQTAVESANAAQASTEVQAALIALEVALTDGLPYRDVIDWIATTQNQAIAQPLANYADTGVASLNRLRDDFPFLAHEAIRADIRQNSDDSTLGQFGSFLQAQVASRSLTPQDGTSTDAILSRAEDALRQGDLDLALRHMRTLSVSSSEIYADWLGQARARQAALGGYQTLKSALNEVAQ